MIGRPLPSTGSLAGTPAPGGGAGSVAQPPESAAPRRRASATTGPFLLLLPMRPDRSAAPSGRWGQLAGPRGSHPHAPHLHPTPTPASSNVFDDSRTLTVF
ncbi:hypothetical protein BN2537_11005 [Streptomyces venezuelae]|nr:hypothetical protein BN2537_11005 [Streptomyces venezuelae]